MHASRFDWMTVVVGNTAPTRRTALARFIVGTLAAAVAMVVGPQSSDVLAQGKSWKLCCSRAASSGVMARICSETGIALTVPMHLEDSFEQVRYSACGAGWHGVLVDDCALCPTYPAGAESWRCCLQRGAEGDVVSRVCSVGSACKEGWDSLEVADCSACPPFPLCG